MSEVEEEDIDESSSSDDEENDEGDELDDPCHEPSSSRHKRSLQQWKPNLGNTSSDCGWPPDPTNEDRWPPWKNLHETKPGNPQYGPRMQLFCSTGWNLGIFGRKDVRGSIDDYDRNTFLELSYAGYPGHLRIQCIENKLYLAMNRKGRLYGEREQSNEATVFIESLHGSYNYYLSRKYAHLGWYVGLKRSGKIKKGPKTAYNQKAIQFLPRRIKTKCPKLLGRQK